MPILPDQPPPIGALWAKLPRGSSTPAGYHPLLAHLVDVGMVARTMWRRVLPAAARERIAKELGLSAHEAGGWVALWAGAHDLGKASPAFARQNPAAWARIRLAVLFCPTLPPGIRAPHGVVTAWALPSILIEQHGLPPALSQQIGRLVGGHHGIFPRSDDARSLEKHPDAVGRKDWRAARRQLVAQLAQLLGAEGAISASAHLSNPTIMYLAGLVSVADWIGSNTDYFPYAVHQDGASTPIDGEYVTCAEQQARKSLGELGWLAWSAPTDQPSFTEMFPRITTPNTLQNKIVQVAEQLDGPSLVVVEAPMGEGKTEAALFLADRWSAQLGQRGVYVALPTQATSNQMFGRVRRFLEHRYPGQAVNLQLLHGHAALSAELESLRQNSAMLFDPNSITEIHDESAGPHADATIVAAEWFTYRKRGLLAPFGVGTVDQALLAALKTKHSFVRLFGLGHKTIIIDEVHAYDTYMTTLLERLLAWLGALGASVVLLSATLPRQRLQRLTAAYATGSGLPAAPTTPETPLAYPRVSWVSGAGVGACQIPPSPRTTTVQIVRMSCQLPSLAEIQAADALTLPLAAELAKALEPGGCAAVICTTVGRAQRMYAALKQAFSQLPPDQRPDLSLFHARFPFAERDAREKDTLVHFGKPGESVAMPDGHSRTVERPHRAVIVATQVIEQSLDLDFDLLVSELAPVDLLLQRLGRLHRHARPNRPAHLLTPTLWLLEPPLADGAPMFERDQQFVYHPHVLLRSWLTLEGRATITIPADVEQLVEAVYADADCPSDAPSAIQARWSASASDLEQVRKDQEHRAKSAVIVPPTYRDSIFEPFNTDLREDEPAAHEAFQALTRLAQPSVPVVLLTPDQHAWADVGPDRPTIEQVRGLLGRSCTLSHQGLVHYLFSAGADDAQPPGSWNRSALLRHHRLLLLDADGVAHVGGFTVRLHPDLGVLIEQPATQR